MTRQSKTPRQRAQEQLDVEERRVRKLSAKVNDARAELNRLDKELNTAITRRDYLRIHPDLAKSGDTATTGATATPRPSTTGGTTR